MGILGDIDITLEQSDSLVKSLALKDYRIKARDFIKKYCQFGDIKTDLYWNDYVIENNIWGEDCQHNFATIARIGQVRYSDNNTYDYRVYFRPVKSKYIGYNINERKYSFIGHLVDDSGFSVGGFDFHPNAVYATTFECDHDCDSIILMPKTNTLPIVIKGYAGKQLPEWLMFEKSIYKQQGYRRTSTKENHISFLLINCNLSKQEIINHVVNSDKTDIYIDIIETS